MAANPDIQQPAATRCHLARFEPAWASLVISWVRDKREMYWLAPKTAPPLTTAEILRWRQPGHDPYMLLERGSQAPVAYGELNRLTDQRRQYWLGHLIVDPLRRGRGLGTDLTRRLLREAFECRGAQRVTLVVFADNARAVSCYLAAGLREDGVEWHEFPAYGERGCLLRFVATAGI